jgi:HSP20 family molecular chaperone IbpA
MIPPDADASKLTARMQHGVLELTLPFREERRAREIEIQGETSGIGRADR